MKRLELVLLVVCLCSSACLGRRARRSDRRLVVIGFDGMDLALVRKWMGQGKLPNLRKLAAGGGLYELGTTPSPEAPPAWASFATGVNPGKHGVYGLLARDPREYRPRIGILAPVPGRFLFGSLPVERPSYRPVRGGTSFWVLAGRQGIRSSILNVPMTFPPEAVPDGELLSGLPLPDLRGTLGTYSYFASDLDPERDGPSVSGGLLTRLVFDGDAARAELVGPADPRIAQRLATLRARRTPTDADRAATAALAAREHLRLPMAVHWNRAGRSATIDVGDRTVHLQEGEWSKWIDVDFHASLLVRLHGMVQVYLAAADKALQLYVSPINWKPDRPPAPMSSPASFAGDLYERLGPYRTLGWAEATWPLAEGRIDERAFMDDVYRSLDDRTQLILQRLDAGRWDLLVGVIGAADRVQHVMWRLIDPAHPMHDRYTAARFGDSIEQVYRRCDEFLGEVLTRVGRGTPVLVLSTYGFHSFRRAVNLNTWLVDQGFMTLVPGPAPTNTLSALYAGGAFGSRVDWSRTRAYAVGFGQIYLNVKGRERNGIVPPGQAARELEDDLTGRLLAFTDPQTAARVVTAVSRASDVYAGPYLGDAPDLQVGFADGYRVSWQTLVGGAPPGVIHPNLQKWSGDHAGFDAADTGGWMVSSRPIGADRLRVVDIAPTVLKYFGLSVPDDLDGQALF